MPPSSTSTDTREILDELAEIVGTENVTSEDCDLICYETDFSMKPSSARTAPDLAIHPGTTEQVSAIAKVANRRGIPLVPRGGGTGMWGGAVPTHGGIVLDMRKMDRVVEVDEETRTVTVQAGVSVRELAVLLERRGFFVADKPESWFAATVGARTQGSGTGYYYNSRYGRYTDQVLSLEVVLPTGEVIRTGPRKAYDPASGYDLTRLFSSAEGTLGIVTEVTLRMYRVPERREVRICEFPSYGHAIRAVMAIRDFGLVPETIETMDWVSYVSYCDGVPAITVPGTGATRDMAALVVGCAGDEKLVAGQMALTREICDRHSGTFALDRCVDKWLTFKETYPENPFPIQTSLMKRPLKYVLDAAVPLEATADLVSAYHRLAEDHGVKSDGAVASHCAGLPLHGLRAGACGRTERRGSRGRSEDGGRAAETRCGAWGWRWWCWGSRDRGGAGCRGRACVGSGSH